VLNNLTGTPQYLSWLAGTLRPYLGDSVLEVGAGIGNIASRLMGRKLLYVAAETDSLHLHALNNRFLRTPNVRVRPIDPATPADFHGLEATFDTVLAVNVLEYLEDPAATIAALERSLKPGGRLIALVPQGPGLYGTLDKVMGHRRRYAAGDLSQLLEANGFKVERMLNFNKICAPPWRIYSRLLRSNRINKLTLKLFDKSVWIWRRLDRFFPWNGLSLIAVARKSD
jgi:SAM-dependent methyltransferase